MTSFDNQLATGLLTTCNRLVVNKLPWYRLDNKPFPGRQGVTCVCILPKRSSCKRSVHILFTTSLLKLSTDLLQVDCQNLLRTSLLQDPSQQLVKLTLWNRVEISPQNCCLVVNSSYLEFTTCCSSEYVFSHKLTRPTCF